jgi:hypothetical protein
MLNFRNANVVIVGDKIRIHGPSTNRIVLGYFSISTLENKMGDAADDLRDMEENLFDSAGFDTPIDAGSWQDAKGNMHQISKMQTSHIENCIKLLQRKEIMPDKIQEFKRELLRRQEQGEEYEIVNHRITITNEDIIECARRKGAKIPASGAGVYFGEKRCTNLKVTVEFDTQKRLSPKESRSSASKRISSRRTLTTGKKGSKRRR